MLFAAVHESGLLWSLSAFELPDQSLAMCDEAAADDSERPESVRVTACKSLSGIASRSLSIHVAKTGASSPNTTSSIPSATAPVKTQGGTAHSDDHAL